MWGLSADSAINKLNVIENKFYKHIFRLPIHFSTTFVMGELGIYPIDINIKIRVIKYWLKLCYNEKNEYSTRLYKLTEDKSEWSKKIKQYIYSIGLGYLWETQDSLKTTYSKNVALNILETRIKDIYLQDYFGKVNSHRYLTNYRNIRSDFEYERENYLNFPTIYNKSNLHNYAIFRANLLGRSKYYIVEKNSTCMLCEVITTDMNKHLYCNCEMLNTERKQIFGTINIQNAEYVKAFSVKNDAYINKVVKLVGVIKKKVSVSGMLNQ